MPSISVVTSTLNSAHCLPDLIDSLEAQTDLDFAWVVADGGSTDTTLALAEAVTAFPVIMDSRPDFGIYDGLNRGIRLCESDYYLVLGSDDTLDPDTIANFKAYLADEPSFVTAGIRCEGQVSRPVGGSMLVYGHRKFVSGHAVGLAIRKSMHEKYGFYSNRFPIAADQFFLQKAFCGGERFVQADFVAGDFAPSGTSGADLLGALSESFRVSHAVTGRLWASLLVFLLKLLKYRKQLQKGT